MPRTVRTLRSLLLLLLLPALLTSCRRVRVESDAADAQTLRAALRTLAAQQEVFYARADSRFSYANSMRQLPEYLPPPGTAVRILEASQRGWSAIAEREGSRFACVFFVGEVTLVPTTPEGTRPASPGVVACDG